MTPSLAARNALHSSPASHRAMQALRRYDPEQPLIFVHLPKCAGTSFIRLLRTWFGRQYRHPHVNEKEAGTRLPPLDLRREDGSWNPEIRCIHAHFDAGRGYGLPEQYPEVQQYFTFLRDPFDIVVSMYFFAKAKSARGEFLYDGKQIDIREQYGSVAEYVSEHPQWLYHHLPQDITLENYREKIAERFVFLGLFEELEESIQQLARLLGKAARPLPNANPSHYDEPIPETLRSSFYQQHPLLKSLHELAREHHAQARRATDRGRPWGQWLARYLSNWPRRSQRRAGGAVPK